VLVSLSLLLTFSIGIFSQNNPDAEGSTTQIKPLLIDLQQRIPVSITMVLPLGESEQQTVTVPVVLNLDLQISVAEILSATGVLSSGEAPVVVDINVDESTTDAAIPNERFRVASVGFQGRQS
jgi:hypothetical protein